MYTSLYRYVHKYYIEYLKYILKYYNHGTYTAQIILILIIYNQNASNNKEAIIGMGGNIEITIRGRAGVFLQDDVLGCS